MLEAVVSCALSKTPRVWGIYSLLVTLKLDSLQDSITDHAYTEHRNQYRLKSTHTNKSLHNEIIYKYTLALSRTLKTSLNNSNELLILDLSAFVFLKMVGFFYLICVQIRNYNANNNSAWARKYLHVKPELYDLLGTHDNLNSISNALWKGYKMLDRMRNLTLNRYVITSSLYDNNGGSWICMHC